MIILDLNAIEIFFSAMKKLILIFIILLIMVGCSQHKMPPANYYIHRGWRYQIKSLVESYPQNKAHWGILVQELDGDTLYSYNCDNLFVPASTLKLVTASAAWKMLGKEYRIPTFIGYDGFRNNHILFGNLIVTGTGDPTLDKRHWQDPEAVFSAWADSLKRHGITEIRGDIIGNDDVFEEQRLGSGWAWDDISFPFSSEFGPLMANNSIAEITILPLEDQQQPLAFIDNLPFDYLQYEDQVTIIDTIKSRIHARRLPGSNTVRLYGNFNHDTDFVNKTITAQNPTLFYTNLLKASLEKSGITISGDARDIDELDEKPETIHEIFTAYSPQLKYIISQFLKDSNNQAGEALLRHLAWKESGSGTFKEGRMIIDVILHNIGIGHLDYRFKDSCGLSRYNLISPSALNKVLIYMNSDPDWINCFSVPGHNGTMEERLTEINADVYAKTGSMSNITCLSGYINKKRKKVIFTIMTNNYLSPQKPAEIIDRILEIIVENN